MDKDCAISVDSMEHIPFEQQLQVEETDDSNRFEFIEIVPLTRDTDGFCTTECGSGDWSFEVKQEDLTVVKQEPVDVCWIISAIFSLLQVKQFLDDRL